MPVIKNRMKTLKTVRVSRSVVATMSQSGGGVVVPRIYFP